MRNLPVPHPTCRPAHFTWTAGPRMRMNGIPARLVSGNFVGNESGHHLRSLIQLQDVGWAPVEATSAISSPKRPMLQFFGAWGGSMLIGNRDIGFELQGPKGKGNILTLDALAFGSFDGNWEFPLRSLRPNLSRRRRPSLRRTDNR
jgi:hypothetical protein